MITFFVIVGFIVFGIWVVYSISKRVEIDHQREWQEFLVLHPELVKKNEPITPTVVIPNTMLDEKAKIKFINDMWERHRAKGDKANESKNR
jgi:hypothetical protein